jgi:2-oxoisovalerate dehydrogenase E1 component
MAAPAVAITPHRSQGRSHAPDWKRVAYLLHLSRALDDIEESKLLPERKVLYQFSARGHDFAQILLGLNLTDAHDGVTVYYRSRPMMLALGVDLEDAAAGPLARSGSFSDGRDIGVVFNMPSRGGPTVLPSCGGVGAQYTPAAGWAQAIRFRREALGDVAYSRSIAVVLGGDASVATNGSGRLSPSPLRNVCRCCFTLRTTVTAFPFRRNIRHLAATLPQTCVPLRD